MPDPSGFLSLLLSFRPPEADASPEEEAPAEAPVLAAVLLDGDEVLAVVRGLMRLIAEEDDGDAAYALEKLQASLPADLIVWEDADDDDDGDHAAELDAIAVAVDDECKLALTYTDAQAVITRRVVWPVLVSERRGGDVLHAWCELRGAFRHFRLDRILKIDVLAETWPGGHARLLRAWRAAEASGET